ncbi:hypothetical protein AB3X31_14530, partial [Raoultella terrigena]
MNNKITPARCQIKARGHRDFALESKMPHPLRRKHKPHRAGLSEESKLAAKPRSFHGERRGQSFALSASSFAFCLILSLRIKQKPRRSGV